MPRPPSAKARMSDVAYAAGVSLVTVSRAINTPDLVAPDTLAAVKAAVDRLGYVPNLTAGSLASNRSRIVAAIVPTISNLVFSETIEALAQTLTRDGYQLLLGQSGYCPDTEGALIDAFLGRRVDGIVLTGTNHSASLRIKLRRAGIPVVQTWDLPGEQGAKAIDMLVGFSNRDAGAAAAEHLLHRGHRTLAFIGADEPRARERLAGFASATRRKVEAELIAPPVQVDAAADSLHRLMARRPEITAIFCNNDLLATGVLFACQQRGWTVPGKLAVMGFGDLPIARAAHPTLSTLRIDRAAIGAQAGRLLLERLTQGRKSGKPCNIGFEVIQRAST
ncbi:LacI family DNA-binding transcriptional regulator [Bordetella muralis]|jgi:LacI family transcriptional regulator, gluconate utilization system Gnt-I transcriptional repressor|uniref:LacI family DNA-binding transcriptional regulator n=1 Tax=Bordetella muralis TaxID=1649130 RepID=UPI0039F08FF0